MLSYALDVWRVSWITAASKAQRGLLAVPEDTSLHKREGRGKSLLSSPLIDKQLVSLAFCQCVCVCGIGWGVGGVVLQAVRVSYIQFHCWPVSKAITGRLLCTFMKYSNGSMFYWALIMSNKGWNEGAGRQKEKIQPETQFILSNEKH